MSDTQPSTVRAPDPPPKDPNDLWEYRCPCCHTIGSKTVGNFESIDLNCINPHCDVRTFRKRIKH